MGDCAPVSSAVGVFHPAALHAKRHHPIASLDPPKRQLDAHGTRLLDQADSVRPIGVGPFGQAASVWGHFGRNISVHKQLIIFIYLSDYTGRQNFTLAAVIPTPFDVAAKLQNSMTGEM